eukprot:13496996-Ditylum_brightwellii.AAC.1
MPLTRSEAALYKCTKGAGSKGLPVIAFESQLGYWQACSCWQTATASTPGIGWESRGPFYALAIPSLVVAECDKICEHEESHIEQQWY